ncbi:hypothetical protein VTK73DRAFT_7267 [Phialemonium thermophilum]|uniref:Uncharacterized protein n=1 Tax=Phialemonium thermophilum TaxID=223376 RepID=A0ABR3WFH1_9PEZI
MCYHNRLIYAGETDEGCGVMWSHPLKTTRVASLCPRCQARIAATDAHIKGAKEILQKVHEEVERIRNQLQAPGIVQHEETTSQVQEIGNFPQGTTDPNTAWWEKERTPTHSKPLESESMQSSGTTA